jgi:hypothetical protein
MQRNAQFLMVTLWDARGEGGAGPAPIERVSISRGCKRAFPRCQFRQGILIPLRTILSPFFTPSALFVLFRRLVLVSNSPTS